jgi:phage shock protein A
MPSFFKRLWNVMRGKGDALLDRLEDPAEQLSVFVSELNDQVRDLQRSVAGAIADEKRLQKQIESLREKSAEWESRAIVALEEGSEDLARSALLKQEECDAEAAALESGWRAQKEATEQLKDSLGLAKRRMDEARRKYTLLLAQYKSAETKRKIQSSLSSASLESPAQLMEQLEERIRSVEAEAEAELALSAESTDTDVEAHFARIDRKRKGDEALAQLKATLAERRELAAGSDPAEPDRVAELKKTLDG